MLPTRTQQTFTNSRTRLIQGKESVVSDFHLFVPCGSQLLLLPPMRGCSSSCRPAWWHLHFRNLICQNCGRKLQITQKVGLQYGGAKINELTGPQEGAPQWWKHSSQLVGSGSSALVVEIVPNWSQNAPNCFRLEQKRSSHRGNDQREWT